MKKKGRKKNLDEGKFREQIERGIYLLGGNLGLISLLLINSSRSCSNVSHWGLWRRTSTHQFETIYHNYWLRPIPEGRLLPLVDRVGQLHFVYFCASNKCKPIFFFLRFSVPYCGRGNKQCDPAVPLAGTDRKSWLKADGCLEGTRGGGGTHLLPIKPLLHVDAQNQHQMWEYFLLPSSASVVFSRAKTEEGQTGRIKK